MVMWFVSGDYSMHLHLFTAFVVSLWKGGSYLFIGLIEVFKFRKIRNPLFVYGVIQQDRKDMLHWGVNIQHRMRLSSYVVVGESRARIVTLMTVDAKLILYA